MATPPRSITLTTEEIKHLELIQAVVTRLANGSFLIKGWTMTVAGIFSVLQPTTGAGRSPRRE